MKKTPTKNLFKSQFSLKGKTAVVTGAVGILGKYFCKGLAEAGANVVVVDLEKTACRKFAKDLQKTFGVKMAGVACDVSDPVSVRRMVKQASGLTGAVDILLNNAATKSTDMDAFFASFEEYSLKEWRRVMSVNIDGMFLVAQAVGRQMIAQGAGGSIIQTASIYGMLAPDHRIYENSSYNGRGIASPAVYAASKAAVLGLTKYLAAYWADKKIRVNALTPGGVESGQDATFIKKYSARVPLGRMAKPQELVGAVVYLASDSTSYVTGQNIVVDGGLSVW